MESSAADRRDVAHAAGESPASTQAATAHDPFAAGAVVMITLAGPREKFWGAIIGITTAGVSASGVPLNSFDDFVRMLRAGEPAAASTVFFPMHRVERIELDVAGGGVPSMRERFEAATGRSLESVLHAALHPTGAAR